MVVDESLPTYGNYYDKTRPLNSVLPNNNFALTTFVIPFYRLKEEKQGTFWISVVVNIYTKSSLIQILFLTLTTR